MPEKVDHQRTHAFIEKALRFYPTDKLAMALSARLFSQEGINDINGETLHNICNACEVELTNRMAAANGSTLTEGCY
jgi:hypothetical protein